MACKVINIIAVMVILHDIVHICLPMAMEHLMQLSFTCMYLLLLVLDPGGGAVGDPLLTIGLSIIVVAVLAIPTVLATIILLTYFYRRFVFIIIIAVEHMLCLGYFHMLATCSPIHK